MSYRSRVYRQRNAHTHEDGQKEGFFNKSHDLNAKTKGGSFFQAKLKVNKQGDQFEKAADEAANALVNKKTEQGPVAQRKEAKNIQRLATSKEEEKKGADEKEIQEKQDAPGEMEMEKEKPDKVQKKDEPTKEEEEDKKSPPLQKKEEGSAPAWITQRIESCKGKGTALPRSILREMNKYFGADFRNVRIHDDGSADEMCRALHAQAFTRGNDIFFRAGKFEFNTAEGKALLTHELTHVIQQTGTE